MYGNTPQRAADRIDDLERQLAAAEAQAEALAQALELAQKAIRESGDWDDVWAADEIIENAIAAYRSAADAD